MAPRARLELATLRLTAECSTIEVPGNRASRDSVYSSLESRATFLASWMTIFSEGKKREGVGFAVMSDKISNERGLHPNGTEPYHTAGTRQSAQKVLSS